MHVTSYAHVAVAEKSLTLLTLCRQAEGLTHLPGETGFHSAQTPFLPTTAGLWEFKRVKYGLLLEASSMLWLLGLLPWIVGKRMKVGGDSVFNR